MSARPVICLTADELLGVARRVVDEVVVRDAGLLESAAARPMARVGGTDACSDLVTKCAALLHSLARNRALAEGNKRVALAEVVVFLGINGARLTASSDHAYGMVMEVAAGRLDDVAGIAGRLSGLIEPW